MEDIYLAVDKNISWVNLTYEKYRNMFSIKNDIYID